MPAIRRARREGRDHTAAPGFAPPSTSSTAREPLPANPFTDINAGPKVLDPPTGFSTDSTPLFLRRPKRSRRTDDLVQRGLDSSRLLSSISSSMNIESLQVVASSCVLLFDTVQLLERVHQIIRAIINLCGDAQSSGGLMSPMMMRAVDQFTGTLTTLHELLRTQAAYGWFARILRHAETQMKLSDVDDALQQALDLFGVQTGLITHATMGSLRKAATGRHDELLAALARKGVIEGEDGEGVVDGWDWDEETGGDGRKPFDVCIANTGRQQTHRPTQFLAPHPLPTHTSTTTSLAPSPPASVGAQLTHKPCRPPTPSRTGTSVATETPALHPDPGTLTTAESASGRQAHSSLRESCINSTDGARPHPRLLAPNSLACTYIHAVFVSSSRLPIYPPSIRFSSTSSSGLVSPPPMHTGLPVPRPVSSPSPPRTPNICGGASSPAPRPHVHERQRSAVSASARFPPCIAKDPPCTSSSSAECGGALLLGCDAAMTKGGVEGSIISRKYAPRGWMCCYELGSILELSALDGGRIEEEGAPGAIGEAVNHAVLDNPGSDVAVIRTVHRVVATDISSPPAISALSSMSSERYSQKGNLAFDDGNLAFSQYGVSCASTPHYSSSPYFVNWNLPVFSLLYW
ncbi:hypothetical protein C8R43DRAFT_1207492 [Mycena crocata]|nr:hypothetical protein C8R43DRAFT_1207492 [Mycena crocata]